MLVDPTATQREAFAGYTTNATAQLANNLAANIGRCCMHVRSIGLKAAMLR
jgi:hypothetical protein